MAPAPIATAASAPPRPRTVAPAELGELAATIGATVSASSGSVSGITLRASDVRPGDLFAALPGHRAHGADFAAETISAGAAALLTDPAGAGRARVADAAIPVLVHPDPRAVLGELSARIYGDPTARLAVIGVTGTSGKTTVVHLVDAGLRAAGHRAGVIGTVETRVAGSRLPSPLTTPEAPDLQALFAVMLESGVTHAAMEVSSHALALGRVAGTRFAVGAFTNLSHDHLDFHGDMASYFEAKARLFDGRAAREVVCTGDEWGRALVRPGTVTVAGSDDTGSDWHAEQVNGRRGGGRSFVAVGPNGVREPVALALPGAYNVTNALVALACLAEVGVPAATAAAAFAEVAVPGRMQPVTVGQPYLAIVDYAHKPAAVVALLDALRAEATGRLLVVLGCGGDRDAEKRSLMGAAAAARAELLVVTDDNPRTEAPAAIRAAVLAGARSAPPLGEVVEVGDRRAAIATAVGQARAGDVVVVAGKGHETGQEIAGVRHPFVDADELAAAIRSLGSVRG